MYRTDEVRQNVAIQDQFAGARPAAPSSPTSLYKLLPDTISHMMSYLQIKDLIHFQGTDRRSKETLCNHRYQNQPRIINLNKGTDPNSLTRFLTTIKTIQELKITGLNTDNKFKLLIDALQNLDENFSFKFLETLDLSNNKLSTKRLQQLHETLFSKLPNLTSLNLSFNKTLTGGAHLIASIQRLKKLNLSMTNIKNIMALAKSSFLQTLNLTQTNFKNIDIPQLAQSLKVLYLSDTNIISISALARLTSLQELDLSRSKITEEAIRQLKQSNLCLKVFRPAG